MPQTCPNHHGYPCVDISQRALVNAGHAADVPPLTDSTLRYASTSQARAKMIAKVQMRVSLRCVNAGRNYVEVYVCHFRCNAKLQIDSMLRRHFVYHKTVVYPGTFAIPE